MPTFKKSKIKFVYWDVLCVNNICERLFIISSMPNEIIISDGTEIPVTPPTNPAHLVTGHGYVEDGNPRS